MNTPENPEASTLTNRSLSFDDWWNDQENGCPTLVIDNDEQFALAVWDAATKRLSAIMVRLYNQGYQAGHEDTVEACFTLIDRTDMDSYHAEVVEEIILHNS